MVIGDFNIDFQQNLSYSDPSALAEIMAGLQFHQLTREATFIKGSLLDHVYIKSSRKNLPLAYVSPDYFSDHDAVIFSVESQCMLSHNLSNVNLSTINIFHVC